MITLFDSKDSIIERFAQVEKVARKWIVLLENIGLTRIVYKSIDSIEEKLKEIIVSLFSCVL